MREFDDVGITSDPALRRQASEDTSSSALLGRAAAAGRPDAVGRNGLLQLQRQVGNAGTAGLLEEERSPVHDVVSSGGEALDKQTRADMESALGQDFSDVRIHRDGAAHESATSVQAKAYTVGSHVVFQRDAFDPSSASGRHTLAHELSHVVQQRSGPVEGTDAPGGIRISDPSDRFEREASQTADHVTAAGPASGAVGAGVAQREDEPERAHLPLQREEAEEDVHTYVQREEPEDDVQTYVQREESEEDVQTYVQREDAEEDVQTYVQRDEEPESEE